MKHILAAVVLFIIGMAIGAWGPRSDLRIARQKIRELERTRASTAPKEEASAMPNITQMLNIPRQPVSPRPRPTRAPVPTPDPAVTPQENVPDETDSEDATMSPDDFREGIAAAHDLWTMREAQARQLLIESLELTESEAREFDARIEAMNGELTRRIEDAVATMKDKEMLTTQDALTLAHGISGVLLDTYEDLDEVLPDNWQSRATADSDLPNFIDPMVGLPLIELEGRMFEGQSGGENL